MPAPRAPSALAAVLAGVLALGLPFSAHADALSFQPSSAPLAEPPSADPPPPAAEHGRSITSSPAPLRAEPAWTVQVLPSLWFVAPSGKLSLPVNSGTGPGAFTTSGDEIEVNDINLDSTRLAPAGELHISSGRFRLTFQGADYELSHDRTSPDRSGRLGAVAFTPSDTLKIDFSFGTYELTGGYRVWDRDFKAAGARPEAAVDAVLALYALVGVRLYDLDVDVQRLTGTPARAETSNLFAEPVIGLRLEATFVEDSSVDVQLTAGYLPLDETETRSLDVAIAFQWRPTPNFGVRLGWRQVAFDLIDGEGLSKFEYEGRLAGLFLGAVVRF